MQYLVYSMFKFSNIDETPTRFQVLQEHLMIFQLQATCYELIKHHKVLHKVILTLNVYVN